MTFILSDSRFDRDPVNGRPFDEYFRSYFDGPNAKYFGHALCLTPFETYTSLNPTTPSGMTTGLMVSLSFQLKKWEFTSQKAEEMIEVNPTYAQYYQLTMKQKEDLEAKIKQSMASVAQSVADLELLKHDQRKYREFLEYLGYRTKKQVTEETKSKAPAVMAVSPDELVLDEDENKRKTRADEHSLKAVFIDQVDAHTGDGISMRSIVSRWPTLIVDFQKLTDTDIDVDAIKKKLDVSKAEAVVLSTKNRLYQEWKKLFVPEIKSRYQRILELIRSREASVEQYRNWLTPYIARHKLLAEGLEAKGFREKIRTSDIYHVGSATSYSVITFWAWRDFEPTEAFRHGGSEQLAKERAEGTLMAYDDWTKKHIIFHPKHGLITEYPWITDEWAGSFQKDNTFYNRRWMLRHKLYYSFLLINFHRGTFRSPTGGEYDDSVYEVNAIYMSQNILYAKMLELEAKKVEFNHYIDKLIGVRGPDCPVCKHETGQTKPYKYEEKQGSMGKIKDALEKFGLNFTFFKSGPYERDWDERITKMHLTGMAKIRYQPVVRFIKEKVGYGVA